MTYFIISHLVFHKKVNFTKITTFIKKKPFYTNFLSQNLFFVSSNKITFRQKLANFKCKTLFNCFPNPDFVI